MEEDDDARSRSQSSSQSQTDSQTPPHPSISIAVTPGSGHHQVTGDDSRVAAPVTVAASPQRALAMAVSVQQPRSSGKDFGGREDCWSEGATSTLIDAWGERYLELKRGNLKQKHWQEVADAVISRDGYTKPPKTDIQCKNRIDTLKKKYKTEKTKISASGFAAASNWPFFHRLDLLLGPNHKPTPVPTPQPPPPPSEPDRHQNILAGVPIRPPSTHMRSQFPQRSRMSNHPAFKKMRSSPPLKSFKSEEGASSADSSDGLPPPSTTANGKKQKQQQQQQLQLQQRGTMEVEERTAGLRELTEAILGFGNVYERMESSKLQQATEMEKQRMAFAKELEVQRMQFFMKTQVELSQLKSSSPLRGESRKRRRLGDVGGSSNHINGNNNNNSNVDNNE